MRKLGIITPLLVTIFGCLTTALLTMSTLGISDIKKDVDRIEEKLFKHLTNDEIHVAKTDICKALQEQYDRLRCEDELRHKVDESIRAGEKKNHAR